VDRNKHSTRQTPQPEKNAFQPLFAFNHLISANQNWFAGLARYATDFIVPYIVSTGYFTKVEQDRLMAKSPLKSIESYLKLLDFNLDLYHRGVSAGLESMNAYGRAEAGALIASLYDAVLKLDGEGLAAFAERQAGLMDLVTHAYPKAIREIEPEYGFHFEQGRHELAAETDRFYLYRIAPTKKSIRVRKTGKPVVIIPPYVLGANILGFLPGEKKSYAHCYADQGIPTYIRILKDINTTEALQVMTGEDDTRDTALFCDTVKKRHGKPVTLNGYCQGGFSSVCNLLTGRLDGLVDAFIACVAPMDGTRSTGLSNFLKGLPTRFNDLSYGIKTLPNGNQVADGRLMGWVYKIKSIEHESPIPAFYRDLMMFSRQGEAPIQINKTAAALNYWLNNERNDLPLAVTEMSFASYNVPVTDDGTLPVRLFGKKLNLKRLREKGIRCLFCYGEGDDLVEKDTALAPLDYIKAEVTPFPKGHVAIATTWSHPDSACALHTIFGKGNYRGPVRFHLDLEDELKKAGKKKTLKKTAAKTKNG